MAKVLTSISLDSPASPQSLGVGQTFSFAGTPSFTGGGGVQRYDWKWEVDAGGGYATIASSGTGLTTAGTNPLVNSNSQTQNAITVTCSEVGSYTIRMAGAPTSGGSYTVLSSTQTVTVSDPSVLVTPDTASLTTATFAPTVSVTDNRRVVPSVASLSLSTFAPTVSATQNQKVTPGVASLTLTTFVPTVTGGSGVTVAPGTASLATEAFAPTVSVSDNKTVTPGTASFSVATFAPTVTATANQLVTPSSATIVIATFAPEVSVSGHEYVGPQVAAGHGRAKTISRSRYKWSLKESFEYAESVGEMLKKRKKDT